MMDDSSPRAPASAAFGRPARIRSLRADRGPDAALWVVLETGSAARIDIETRASRLD